MTHYPPTEADRLGAPIAEYKARSFNTRGGVLMAMIGLLFLFLSCQVRQDLVVLGILGLIFVPFGVLITVYGIQQRGLRLVLHMSLHATPSTRQSSVIRYWLACVTIKAYFWFIGASARRCRRLFLGYRVPCAAAHFHGVNALIQPVHRPRWCGAQALRLIRDASGARFLGQSPDPWRLGTGAYRAPSRA